MTPAGTRVALVGAGLAGLRCAQRLRDAGFAVSAFDKGRGPGGRMSSRRADTPLGTAGFDHGAQYFTARDPGFRDAVAAWAAAGDAAPWPAAGADAWVGTPTMNAPLRRLAAGIAPRWGARVDAVERDGDGWRLRGEDLPGERYDAVLLAVPAEQAAPLLRPWDAAMAGRAEDTPARPCWTVMAAFAGRLPVAADVLRGASGDAVGWAARDSGKPGRSGPESWVIQAGPDWSAAHLEQSPEAVLRPLLDAFALRAGLDTLPEPVHAAAHRWRYSRSGAAGDGALWNPALRLGACGDWLLGPRVECAWLSGGRLAEAVAGRAATAGPR